MAMDRARQVADTPEPHAIGRWPIDEPFPAVLRDCDLMRVTPWGHSQFYILKAKGAFRFLEIRQRPLSSVTLYSGHLVRQWARGELGTSRYFQRASEQTVPVTPIAGRRPGRPRKSTAPLVLHDTWSVTR